MAELGLARFASSVRSNRVGAGAALAPGGLPRLVVDVSLKVTETSKPDTPEQHSDDKDAGARVELLGPGDVVGIAPSEVLRVFPNDGEHAAEPNYLAAIEFDSPELPWLVSLSAREPAQPWIALVVVPDDQWRVSNQAGSLLPWLAADTAELPPPGELWAWAHAHAQGDANLQSSDPGDGRRTLSRLLCPTQLQPNTAYVAAVVPTYLAGVLAARRQNPGEAGDKASWAEGQGAVELPVYHHWRFVTGAAGDFEELARELSPIDASDIDGLGRIDLRARDGWLGRLPPQELHSVRTLLVSPEEDAARDAEAPVLDGDVPRTIEEAVDAGPQDQGRVVRPPRYGQWPAGDAPVRGGPGWYAELNLQPHRRVVARLGADLIRSQQEELVAEARRQLGEYRAARRIRDLLRIGEMTATRLHVRAVADQPDERIVTMARPVLRSLLASAHADGAVVETMAAEGFGTSLLATSFARIAQRVSAQTGVAAASMRAEFVGRAMKGDLVKLPVAQARPRIDVDRVRVAFDRAGILGQQVEGISVDTLLNLAPTALIAQDQLVAEFSGAAIEIQRVQVAPAPAEPAPAEPAPAEPAPVDLPPVDDGGLAGPLLRDGDRIHVRLLPDVPDSPDIPDVVLRQSPGLRHLRPEVREAIIAQPQAGGFDAAAVRALRVPFELPAEIAELRIDNAAREHVSRVITQATSTLTEVALQQGLPGADARFTDLLVDQHTMDLATTFQQEGGGAPLVIQLDARQAVRRNLGRQVFGPVLRDQLTDEGRRQFDDVVAVLGERQVTAELRFPAAPPRVTVAQVAAPCREQLRANESYKTAAMARLPFAQDRAPSLITMGFVPEFFAPVADRLQRSLSKWVLAGADRVPPNTISVVMTNPAFVEAFTAGANHEMARELLWRDVPWDARGTVFRRFWNTPMDQPDKFLTPVHTWREPLGKNLGTGSPYLCVLVRSPLLRRYPNAVVQAAQGQLLATPNGGKNFEPDPATFRALLFQGAIAPDITYSVIDVTEDEVRGAVDNPWYLLLGEPVTEPKFGLDAEAAPTRRQLTSWRDLAWTDVTDGAVLRVGDANLANQTQIVNDPVRWGTDAAAIARILHQDPFRLVLPALQFLGMGG